MKTVTSPSETLNERMSISPQITLVVAFAGVYVLWGSTYLAMSILVKTVPMFLMAGFRFLLASGIMFIWAFIAKHPLPTMAQILKSSKIGFFLLVIGNGGILVANRFISSSGVIAILVSVTPLIIIFLEWLTGKSGKPPLSVWIGSLIGLAGMLILSGAENLKSLGTHSWLGLLMIGLSCVSWAVGTLYAKTGQTPHSPIFNSGIQMLFSSMCMFVMGTFHNEWNDIVLSRYGGKEAISFLYLVLGGSVLGFTSYTYIARNASSSSVSTYAYVNPTIALFLGWWIGKEEISLQTVIASCMLVGAVALIVMKPKWNN